MRIIDSGEVLRKVAEHAEKMASLENQTERGYARLGWFLLEVSEMDYWRIHHDTFRDYLKTVSMLSGKSVAQLQLYCLAVRDLSDTFNLDALESMGITKALQLRRAKDYALVLPAIVVNAALDPKMTSKDLKKVISLALKMPDEEGDWLDCEMEFMVTAEQRATIEQAIDVAMHTDPVTKTTIAKSAQMLDVMLKLAQEFLGSHCGDGI